MFSDVQPCGWNDPSTAVMVDVMVRDASRGAERIIVLEFQSWRSRSVRTRQMFSKVE